MERNSLIRITAHYITDFLNQVIEGTGELISKERRRFFSIVDSIPEATIEAFRSTAYYIDDLAVADIASLYGETFGLWIAANNPTSQVHVYNPAESEQYPEFLFSGLNPRVYELRERVGIELKPKEALLNFS